MMKTSQYIVSVMPTFLTVGEWKSRDQNDQIYTYENSDLNTNNSAL
jgi:hypothetical protein